MPKKKENPEKRGPKPRYGGSRRKLLEEHLEEYIALRSHSRNQFWFDFFAKWWKNFPWKLDNKEEPPLDDPVKMSELASAETSELDEKSRVEAAVVARIKTWFNYQSQNRLTRKEDTWNQLLQRLHESANTKPRKRSVLQQFMLDKPSLIDAEFATRFKNHSWKDGAERMNSRREVAKMLLEEHHQRLIPELEEDAEKAHKLAIQQWSLKLDNIGLAADIGDVHHVPDDKASRQNWTEWDTDGFLNGVARPFKKYIKSMEVDKNRDDVSSENPSGAEPLTIAVSAHPPRPDAAPTLNATAPPKRTAAGKYKRRPIADTEGGSSNEWDDARLSDSDGNSQKRSRTDTIVIRGRKAAEFSGSSPSSPLDSSTLLQSPVPPSRRIVYPLDNAVVNPLDDATVNTLDDVTVSLPDPQSTHQSASNTDQASTRGGPPPVMVETNTPSDTAPAEPTTTTTKDTGITAVPLAGDVLSGTDFQDARPAAIPQFLAVAQKKSKISVYGYLSKCKDSQFQHLLQIYIRFENAASPLGQTGSLPTPKRPSQISQWIRSARVDTPPSWSDLRDYGSSVITWWSSLQPSWRKLEYGTSNREDGSFGCLFQPGVNGLLNVVILAYWWCNDLAEPGADYETESSRCCWFVADVAFVLLKLLETVSSN